MSFLYPLLLAGMAAVSLPIVLHLIRRHTRHHVTFSSLMFLRATLPRFRSRSRLEHIPLLLLRCLVLCLLALAFARPFLPRAAALSEGRAGKRIVLLLDTSASMRRMGMWTRAVEEAKSVLEDAGPSDRVSVMHFDRAVQTLVSFEQWATMEPAQRTSIVMQEISRLSPEWGATHLGQALVAAAEVIEDDEVDEGQRNLGIARIVLVGDLQRGSDLRALLAYEWPQRTELVVRAILCEGATNASVQLVTSRDHLGPSRAEEMPDIRVSNSSDAEREHFLLGWADEALSDAAPPLDVYVPPGRSVVVRGPKLPEGASAARLVLTGDDHEFDNVLYAAPRLRRQIDILYIGADDPNDPDEMLFYVRKAFQADRATTARVISRPGDEVLTVADVETAHLVIISDVLSRANLAPLRRYLETGRTILLVMKSAETASVLEGLAGGESLECREVDTTGYAMLGRVEFDHPLLKPFSDPRFADFTRIHFWKHRRMDMAALPGARTLAWYDDSSPAWFEMTLGRGTLLVWTSGWHPSDSDLALSSKFVPLMYSILEYVGTLPRRQAQYFVGDPVPIAVPMTAETADLQIRTPDDSIVRLGAGQQAFAQTNVPGIYTLLVPDGNRSFAVNVNADESRTDAMPVEELEKLGVSLKLTPDVAVAEMQPVSRHRNFSEMESDQKLWRWMLLAALVVLLIEIWLGGWLTRPSGVSEGEQI